MAVLSRFINKLREKGLAFFKLLKKVDKFEWDDETSKELEQLKAFLTTPPVMTAPADQETLYLYISATTHVVSTVLVVEREDPGYAHMVQQPVYYVSEVLNDSKIRYTQVQKLLYAVLFSSKKLRHYFQVHKICMLKYVLQIYYKVTNNGAKYKALIHVLRIDVSLRIKRILAYSDSKVVIE
ncbi:uncharacterized protein [Setaria viridis]|uniref:uncharacterized protein n=1 Tax=Setaria viridis TaxID=4556 RepID=UPI003B3B0E07